MIPSGLYRSVIAHPLAPEAIPAGKLVFVGRRDADVFCVVPYQNRQNRWYWQDPVTPLTDEAWASTLMKLPSEGFYTLPETLEFEGGGRWVKNAIVQLGYNLLGEGIIFVAERREGSADNALYFSDRGQKVDDAMLNRLQWAPILPVQGEGVPTDTVH